MTTVAECLLNFENSLIAQGKSPETKKQYTTKVKLFLNWFATLKKPLLGTTTNDLNAFIAYRQNRALDRDKKDTPNLGRITKERGKLSTAAIAAYQIPIKAFFRINWPAHEIALMKTVRQKQSVPTIIQANELVRRATYKNVFDYYNDHGSKNAAFYSLRDWCLITFLIDTGARISAARNLKHSDLFLEEPKLFVHLTSKGKTVTVPLSADWKVIYRKYTAHSTESTFVFSTSMGNQLNTAYLGSIIVRHTGYSPHKFRHFYAVTKLEKNSIVVVQRLLGHSNISVTSRYLSVVQEKNEVETESPLHKILK